MMIDTQTKIRCCNVDLESLEFDGETVLCRVCGDKASGFHYGVHACEGCKGFFRRSIQQKIQYRPCVKNQECSISRVNRNRCQYCRLKKCIAVGMSRDAVRFGRVPKKEKAKILEQMQKVNLNSQTNYLSAILQNDNHVISQTVKAHAQTNEFTREKFERFQKRAWQKPEFITCSSNKACPLNPHLEGDGDKRWSELSDSFTPAIQSVVDFSKAIPGFTVLNQEDQVTLLKAGTFEVLLLRLACLFDCRTNTMLFVDGKLYKKNSGEEGTCGFLQESMFEFAERLNDLKLTDDEMGLFAGIVIIASNRPGLRNAEHVECIQAKLTHGLQTMMLQNHPDDPALFGKLLMKIPDLRTLNTLHSEKLLGMSLSTQTNSKQPTPESLPENDRMDVSDPETTHCPYSDQRQVVPSFQQLQQQDQQQQQQQQQSFHPYNAVSRIIPNVKHDLTSLPKYQSQLDMVKKIKAEMSSQHTNQSFERSELDAPTTPSLYASSQPPISDQKAFPADLLKHRQAFKQSGYPVDEYLHASMMSHLKQKVLTADKDRFQTVRGMLNAAPEYMYAPYYPYVYPNEMLYQYYPYRFPPPVLGMNRGDPRVGLNSLAGRLYNNNAKVSEEYRDRSPPPSPRWRLGSTGSRNSPKTEDSSSHNSSSSSPNSWNEPCGQSSKLKSRDDAVGLDGTLPGSPGSSYGCPSGARSSPKNEQDRQSPVENVRHTGSEPLNLCIVETSVSA